MKIIRIQTPENWREIEHHPLSGLIGFGVGIDIEQMAADMQANGYDDSEPMILFDGKVFDGRHRQAGAIMAEIEEPPFAEFQGTYAEAIRYVSKKIRRQHLDASQRAMFGAALANLPEGRPSKTSVKHDEKTPSSEGVSAERAADMADVSVASVERAKVVIEKGTPELQQAVKDRTITVTDAAKVADAPPKVQNKAVADVRKGESKTASGAVAKLCKACRISAKGPTPNCTACKELAGLVPKPSANGTHTGTRTGKELFSWATFYDQFRPVAQSPDKIAAAYPKEKDGPEFEKSQRLLNEFVTLMKAWQRRLEGKK